MQNAHTKHIETADIIDLDEELGQEWEQELKKVEEKVQKLEETKEELFVSWPQDPHRYNPNSRRWGGGPHPSPPKNHWGFIDHKALYFVYE